MKPVTGICCLLLCLSVVVSASAGDLTNEQKRELSGIRSDTSKVSSLIRQNKFDEARSALDALESQLQKLADLADLRIDDRQLAGVQNAIVRQRHSLALHEDPKKYRDEQNSVSFVKHIAPILQARCVECHADDPAAGLKLDSFAGMKQGGKSGPLLTMGVANRSLIMYRLAAPEQHRMPQKEAPLTRNELMLMAVWINQGAKFDGPNEELDLDELLHPKQVGPPKEFPKPVGTETVSFRNDIAPFLVSYCLRCHQGKKPSGDLLLVDFESIMRGGRSGRIIVPGNPEESLMYQLMASYDEASRMPLEGKVTKQNFDDLTTWIREGAKYDGETSRLHLRSLNPAASEMKAAELASLTTEQFEEYRESRSQAQWKKAFPETPFRSVTSPEILCIGDISTGRLTQLLEWSGTHLNTLRELLSLKSEEQIWRGKLVLFVISDRTRFEEFNQKVALRRVFPENFGTAIVHPAFEDAFIVLQDTGDESDETTPAMHFSLLEQLTAACLAATDATYPEWLTVGLGPALAAAEVDSKDAYVESIHNAVAEPLGELENPADVFHDGVFFSAEQARPVAVTLTQFLLKRGRTQSFSKLILTLQQGGDIDNSIRVVYGAEPEIIARAYLSALKIRRR
ncbi:MAG: hypothetical protein KDA89_16210 [Planctomycetaceae bacterium]|nr:hypothetical protein [Planctomycetaceae bacterium]